MKRILIITVALLIGLVSYGQTSVNKRIMLDSLNNKASIIQVRATVKVIMTNQ